ncbi:Trehalose-6-P synthase/phosphatase complex synthase subunit [Phlyctochytrium bullatum]|nr:Trehalose-6-P synthase/phosphatase complex synthase subunit [Phlyctochytrium bullatum]
MGSSSNPTPSAASRRTSMSGTPTGGKKVLDSLTAFFMPNLHRRRTERRMARANTGDATPPSSSSEAPTPPPADAPAKAAPQAPTDVPPAVPAAAGPVVQSTGAANSAASVRSELPTGRLLVVSNRLPITIKRDASGTGWKLSMSSGGLVSALSGLKKDMSFTWFGWPGLEIVEKERAGLEKRLMDEYSAVPVFISDEMADMHYNGFSNSILWPLFHYHPGEITFNEDDWEAYQQANVAFADALIRQVNDGDLIWVHDYHLMLLPALLRERLGDRFPNVKIGFFLHTPFPSSEIYRILPVRRQVLLGVLQSDLVGFHTYDYARHFLSSCTRILGLQSSPNGVEFEGRHVHVGTFPIGIDPEKFIEGLKLPAITQRISFLEERFRGIKVLVGVDRLDYIKGVPQKLTAFEQFLNDHPEWVGKVVLIQVAVPSRQDVEEYRQLQDTVNGLVGRINGRFGTVEFTPIHFLHKSIPFEELVSLYAVGDACLVTSTRDGMNLVSYEYVASQLNKNGVLVLSEFAGAAQSLNGALIINPWNKEDLAEAIYDAVTMPDEQRAQNHDKIFRYILKYTAAHWGLTFVRELQRVTKEYDPSRLIKFPIEEIVRDLKGSSTKKIIFLDYDGTLTATHRLPEFAQPTAVLKQFLNKLASRKDFYVYILSGRSRKYLDRWFGDTNLGLSAEHGFFYRHPRKLQHVLEVEVDDEEEVVEDVVDASFVEAMGSSHEVVELRLPRDFEQPPTPDSDLTLPAKAPPAVGTDAPVEGHVAPAAEEESADAAAAAANGASGPLNIVTPASAVPSYLYAPFRGIPAAPVPPSPTTHSGALVQTPGSPGLPAVSAPPMLSTPPNGFGSARAGSYAGSTMTPLHSSMTTASDQFLNRNPRRSSDNWLALGNHINPNWKDMIRPLFEHYTERTPGSFIEEKEVNIMWNYRGADPEFGSWQAAELQVNLEKILSHMAVTVILGNKTVELRPSLVDKSIAARAIIRDLGIQPEQLTIVSIGDGQADEALFHYLRQDQQMDGSTSAPLVPGGGCYTATVGKKQTDAAYYVESVRDVEKFITLLAADE